MENNQDRIDELIFGYFAGVLLPEEQKELKDWLRVNKLNQSYFSKQADLWAMAHMCRFEINKQTNFVNHFSHIYNRKHLLKSIYNRTRHPLLKIAASLLVLLATATIAYFVGINYSTLPQAVASFQTTTPLGAKSKVLLPDGTVVWVNSGSTLRYNSDFNGITRQVSLDGEAYFEVAHNQAKPFVVKTNEIDVKVLGTRFNVKAYSVDETVDVSLISGKVNVHLNDKTSNKIDVILQPDRMLTLHKKSDKVEIVEIKGSDANAWTNGMLTFTKQSFVNIAQDLERKYNIQIIIKSKKLTQEIFTGSFASNYTLDQILEEIDVDGKYVWEYHNSKLTINDK